MREHKELKELVELLDANKDNIGKFTLGLYDGKEENGNLDITVMIEDKKGLPLGIIDIVEDIPEDEATIKGAVISEWLEEGEYNEFYDTEVIFDYEGYEE